MGAREHCLFCSLQFLHEGLTPVRTLQHFTGTVLHHGDCVGMGRLAGAKRVHTGPVLRGAAAPEASQGHSHLSVTARIPSFHLQVVLLRHQAAPPQVQTILAASGPQRRPGRACHACLPARPGSADADGWMPRAPSRSQSARARVQPPG
eukprot:scaffold2979_cov405-Prasinococcus_capsulatus_cf.AAC.16